MVLLLPFLALGALEILLRLGGYGYDPHFFKRLKIGGEDCFVQNEDFSFRFFPRQIARNPGPLRFPVRKAPDTYRIFVLGESAAMGDPAQSVAPDRYLEMLLREKYPGTNFEVINVAFTAINSHVILPIARECARHEGDLWIIYMGNNEMVGPFGAATVFGWRAPAWPWVRLVTGIQRLRIGQWLMDLGRKLARRGHPAATWGGMAMFLNSQIAPDSPLKESVYRNFQRNLDDIVALGVDSGAKVLLNTVAVNLKDCPPFASITNGARPAAELEYLTGQSLLAQTNLAGAREHFQSACDLDALPFRTDSRINEAIRGERKKAGGGDLILYDAATALAAPGAGGVCGEETFFEHVHFDFDARYRLGRAWAGQVEGLLPPNTNRWLSQAACDQMVGLSALNGAQIIHYMVERLQLPPLSSQANNRRRLDALEERQRQLRATMNPENGAATRNAFLQTIAQRPNDFFLRENFAIFLELIGDLPAAATQWQTYRDLVPQESLGHYQAGRLLNALQRFVEAEAALRAALRIRPSRTDGWIELGNCLAMQKKYAEALVCFSTALDQDSLNAQTWLRQGKAMAQLNRHPAAIESYRAAIRLNPADDLSHHELGLELARADQQDAAGHEFAEAARLNPDRVADRFDFGAWLLKHKRWPEAQNEFEAVLRLEPSNLRAQKNLAWLRTTNRQGAGTTPD